MRFLLVISFASACLAATCAPRCTSNEDCKPVSNMTMCCVSGACKAPKLLSEGSACTVGLTQAQMCGATGGECAASFVFSTMVRAVKNPDALCVDNVCRPPRKLNQNCACENSTQCSSFAICDGVCLDTKKVGEACVSNQQCKDNPVCEGGVCKGLPAGAACNYNQCFGSGCSDGCAVGLKCLESTSKCTSPLAEGAACSANDCEPGIRCYAGACTKNSLLGQNCTSTRFGVYPPSCASQLFCDVSLRVPICKSVYSKPIGQNCSEHNECVSKACRGLEGQKVCSDSAVIGTPCNSTGRDDCSEDSTCDCKTGLCEALYTGTMPPCYAEAQTFGQAIFSSGGFVEAALDYYCCLGCTLKQPLYGNSVDCTTRKISAPANACTSPQAIISGCSGWVSGANSSTQSTNAAAGIPMKIVAFLLVVFPLSVLS